MYYLPLSTKSQESARHHAAIGRENLKFVCNNIMDAVLYEGDDNELTNWAKSNTLNMLHLLRFVKYSAANYNEITEQGHIIPELTINVLGANATGFDYSGTKSNDGYIYVQVNTKWIKMKVKTPSKKRQKFLDTMPIPVSNPALKENIVWYNRLYYKMMTNEEINGGWKLLRRDVSLGDRNVIGAGIYTSGSNEYKIVGDMLFIRRKGGNNPYGGECLLTEEDESEFMHNLNEIVNTYTEII